MKLCLDKQCRRRGQELPLDEFNNNKAMPDGKSPYCKECWLKKVHEYRARVRQRRAEQRNRRQIKRKPMVVSPIVAVKEAIAKGCKTRNEIKAATRLPWDDLGVVLADLTFEFQELRIVRVGEKREFHIAA